MTEQNQVQPWKADLRFEHLYEISSKLDGMKIEAQQPVWTMTWRETPIYMLTISLRDHNKAKELIQLNHMDKSVLFLQ